MYKRQSIYKAVLSPGLIPGINPPYFLKFSAVSYGLNAIEEASEQGAVETLIVEASLLRSDDRSIRSRWDGITSAVTTNRGEVIQASIDHDAGQQLVGMGGAIALLRWKVD